MTELYRTQVRDGPIHRSSAQVEAEALAYTVTLGSGTLIVGYRQRAMSLEACDVQYLHDVRPVHTARMVGEFLLAVCFVLGCAVFGCGRRVSCGEIPGGPAGQHRTHVKRFRIWNRVSEMKPGERPPASPPNDGRLL